MKALAFALVRFAAGRWASPEETAREWEAELHELSRQGETVEMLRFSISLALSRPGSAGTRQMDWSGVKSSAALILGPVACVFLAFPSVFAVLFVPIAFGVALLARAAGRRNPFGGRQSVLPALAPIALCMLFLAPPLGIGGQWSAITTWIWFALLTIAVVVTAAVPARQAMATGVIGIVAAAWLTTTLLMWLRNLEGWGLSGNGNVMERLEPGGAPWWFLVGLLGVQLAYLGPQIDGLPTYWIVADYVEVYPHLLMLLGLFAVGFVAGSRQNDARKSGLATVTGAASSG